MLKTQRSPEPKPASVRFPPLSVVAPTEAGARSFPHAGFVLFPICAFFLLSGPTPLKAVEPRAGGIRKE